jgi:hypothetical protein
MQGPPNYKTEGNCYTGSGDYAYYDVNGNVVLSGTFTITATSILVEAPQ